MKNKRESRSSGLVPVRPKDSVDILERVLTQGAVVERVDDDSKGEFEDTESTSLRVSIGGIDVLNVQTDLSWRSLDEPNEPSRGVE